MSLLEVIQNIYKLERHSGHSTTPEKYLGTPGTPGVLEVIQKYL